MMVWIKCPEHGRAVPTGIDVQPASFGLLPETVAGFTCSACGGRHDWHRRDAWLAESYPARLERRLTNDGAPTHSRPTVAAPLHWMRARSWSVN